LAGAGLAPAGAALAAAAACCWAINAFTDIGSLPAIPQI
jgi:hypothetical protein